MSTSTRLVALSIRHVQLGKEIEALEKHYGTELEVKALKIRKSRIKDEIARLSGQFKQPSAAVVELPSPSTKPAITTSKAAACA